MKTVCLVGLLGLILLCSCEDSLNKQRSEIRLSFFGFSQAFYARKGEEALPFVSRRTFDYYDRLLPDLLFADEKRLSELPPFALFACLALRYEYRLEELKTMTGRMIVREAFNSMTFPGGAPHFLDIGEILIRKSGEEATATVFLAPGEKHDGALVSFIREDGMWKVDLTSVFEGLSSQLEAYLKDPTASRAERALHYLQVHENRQIGGEILQPMGR